MQCRLKLLVFVMCIFLMYSVKAQNIEGLVSIRPENVDNMELLATVGNGWVVDADFSPDNATIALSGSTGIWIYNLDIGDFTYHLSDFDRIAYPIYMVVYSPDGKFLAGVICTQRSQYGLCVSSQITIFETGGYTPFLTIDASPQHVNGIDFSPDATTFAYVADGDLYLYDLTREMEIHGFDINEQTTDVKFSGDNKRIAISSFGGTYVLSVDDLTEICYQSISANKVALNSNGTLILTSIDQSVKVTEVDSCREIASYGYDNRDIVSELEFNDKDDSIVYVTSSWNGEATQITVQHPDGNPTIYHTGGRVYSIHLSGKQTFAIQGTTSTVEVAEYPSSNIVAQLNDFFPSILSIAVSPDANRFAVAYQGGLVNIFRTDDKSLYSTIESEQQDFANDIAFSYDSKYLAITQGTEIDIWDVNNQAIITTLTGHTANVYALGFANNGEYLLTASVDMSMRVWNTDNWEQTAIFENAVNGRSLGTGYDLSKFVIGSASGEGVSIWDANTLDVLDEQALGCCITSVAMSPDSKTVAVGMENGAVLIFDHGQSIHIPTPITFISDIAYSQDGNLIVADGMVIDSQNHSILRLLDQNTMRLTTVDMLLDDRLLLLGNQDGTVRIWGMLSKGN